MINHLSAFLMELGKGFMYVNYYNKEIKDEYDHETIGIILCTGKNDVTMEYALGGLSNKVFASTYTYYIPNKNDLISEVEKVIKREIDV